MFINIAGKNMENNQNHRKSSVANLNLLKVSAALSMTKKTRVKSKLNCLESAEKILSSAAQKDDETKVVFVTLFLSFSFRWHMQVWMISG